MFILNPGKTLPTDIRLCVSDVDNTLVPQGADIFPDGTLQILQESKAPFSLCTGRTPKETMPLIEQLPQRVHYAGGGSVKINPDGRCVVHSPLTYASQLLIHAEASRANAENIFYLVGNDWVRNPSSANQPIGIISVACATDLGRAERLRDSLLEKNDRLSAVVTNDGPNIFLHVTNSNAHKGAAVEGLKWIYKLSRRHIAGFGDGDNDKPLFDAAGFSVKVDPATYPHLLTEVDASTASVADNGMYHALQGLGLFPRS